MGIRGELFSVQIPTEKRSYFFNVKENRRGDLFLNIVESRQTEFSGFQRDQLMVYREDLENFLDGLNKAVNFIKKKEAE